MNPIEYTRENCKAIDAQLIAAGCRPIFADYEREEIAVDDKEMFG